MPKERDNPPASFRFSGFDSPNFTQIPDQLLDELLPILSGNETKTLLYICRRTFGFKKDADNISLAQMVSGITTKEGTQLDGGTGLSKASVARSLKSLEEKKVIRRVRRSSPQKGDLPTTYILNFRGRAISNSQVGGGIIKTDPPRVSDRDTPVYADDAPRVSRRDTQQTAEQQRAKQKTTATSAGLNNPQPESGKHSRVVDVLRSKGISKKVSETLANTYSPDYILKKVSFLDFLLSRESNIVKRPAAWLRTAIQDDYSAPDGFKTDEELQRQANAEKRRKQAALASQEAHERRIAEQSKERNAAVVEQQEALFQKFGTTEHEREIWQQFQSKLAAQGYSQFKLAAMRLLKITENAAVISVSNEVIRQQILKSQDHKVIQETLSQICGRALKVDLRSIAEFQ